MDMQKMMQQAQEMQKKFQQAQQEHAEKVFKGKAGGDMVVIEINGQNQILNINIDPSLLVKDNKEVLEDLIKAAFANAKKEADEDANNSNPLKDLGGLGESFGLKF